MTRGDTFVPLPVDSQDAEEETTAEMAHVASLERQVRKLQRFVVGAVLLSSVSTATLLAVVLAGGVGFKGASPSGPENSLVHRAAALLTEPAGAAVSPEGLGLRATAGQHPALMQKWSGPDRVIVPYGFNGCDTSQMPPQIAPVRRAGDFLFLSGILGYNKVCASAEPDPGKQIELAFHWADVALRASGSDWTEVMSVTSYHLDLKGHMDTFVRMRKKYLPPYPLPAWTAVQVGAMYFPDEVYEMTLIALRKPCDNLECDR